MRTISKLYLLGLATFLACSFDKSELAGPPMGGVDAGGPPDVPAESPGSGGSPDIDAGSVIPSSGGAGGSAPGDAMPPDGPVVVGGTTSTGGSIGTGGTTGIGGSLASPDAGPSRDTGDIRVADKPSGQPICGDGVVSTGEQCDDGNLMPFDGCSSLCRYELQCTTSGCTSKCGDGIVLGEDCDDGNNADGDGCSSTCQVETGWSCTQPPLGDKMMVPAVYRDFKYHNPSDFQVIVSGSYSATLGMVKDDLDSDGKPAYTGLVGKAVKVTSESTFAQWYRNTSGINHATTGQLALWKKAEGVFVNRYGPNGEQWNATEKAYFCGYVGEEKLDDSGKPIPCTSKTVSTTECTDKNAKGLEMLKCFTDPNDLKTYQALYITKKLDGTPLWFPVDGDTTITPKSEFEGAKIPPLYETGDDTNTNGTYPYDLDASGNKVLHNFSFTSEIRTWFRYEAAKPWTLEFIGDEDVWVFINKKLAVDIGGIHLPAKGSVTLDAATAKVLGLVDGGVYEIAVFQAERETDGSTLKVAFPGFNTAPSACTRL